MVGGVLFAGGSDVVGRVVCGVSLIVGRSDVIVVGDVVDAVRSLLGLFVGWGLGCCARVCDVVC